jgi:E3 ubiquitin-protein ligase MYCBP2
LDILNRPVMSFLLQQHNLEALQLAMRQALRKAACRVYAMQVKFLKTVTCLCRGVAYNGVLVIQPSYI